MKDIVKNLMDYSDWKEISPPNLAKDLPVEYTQKIKELTIKKNQE